MYSNLPIELKKNALFCLWKLQNIGERTTKLPFQVNGKTAKSNDVNSFTDFNSVCNIAHNYDGIGMGVFNGYSAIDIDHCVCNGKVSPMAQDVINIMNSYTEYSPSGTGIRIVFKVNDISFDKAKYYINNASIGLEVYVSGVTNKFVTLTGNAINDCDVKNCDNEIMLVLNKYMLRESNNNIPVVEATCSLLTDELVLEKAMNCKNGDKFTALWNGNIPVNKSASEADMALACHLAFWCGGDIEQMDRLFRQSGLMRDKWDRKQSGSTYGNITLNKAVENSISFYEPIKSCVEDDFNDIANMLYELDPIKKYSHNDIGTSKLFADVFKGILRYVPQRKSWFYYDGIRWQEDVSNLYAMEKCKVLMYELAKYSLGTTDQQYIKYCANLQSRRLRLTILNDAQSVYPIDMGKFDENIYLFNCQNGTLNLETGEFREHRADDFITKLSPVAYNTYANSKRFDDFVNEIMSNDKDKAEFLQKALGYALSGNTRYECMFILYGATTRNGKGTLMESMLNVMGDYGKAVKPETIAIKQNTSSSTPSEDIARLAGLRLANISEPSKGLVLNAAQVKSMTGNDTLNARFLHENSFDFKPQFKIYVNTNYLPVITDMTLFSSNRIFIIPFDRHFEDYEQDRTLKSYFMQDEVQSAILNWLIDGFNKLNKYGLEPSNAVIEATKEYRHDSDKILLFVEDCLIRSSSDVKTSVVYSAYQDWCSTNGLYPESSRTFNQNLRTIGDIKRKRPINGGEKTTLLMGYKLNPETTDRFLQ